MARTAIIVGCGIAGPVAALALRKAGWRPEIYEASPMPLDEPGLFLNVVANGMNALKTIGVRDRVAAQGFPFGGIVFHEERGREVGRIDYGDQERAFGAAGIVIKRGALQRALREAALEAGVPVTFGKKLVAIEQGAKVTARFADGSSANGDVVVGCDGIRSRTRRSVFADAAEPAFTGLYGYGGFSRGPGLPATGRMMHMHFGRKAFFGHAAAPDGEVYWFGNVGGAEGEDPGDAAAWIARLHAEDPEPVPSIVGATIGELGWYPIHEMSSLKRWHEGRVVLLGDAAHAMSPHVGQGASLAIEDAVVLAKCLRDLAEPGAAFERYQDLRRERVEMIGREARRSGDRKIGGPFKRVVRNLLLPMFLKLGERASREAYAHRIDWDQPTTAESNSDPLRRAA